MTPRSPATSPARDNSQRIAARVSPYPQRTPTRRSDAPTARLTPAAATPPRLREGAEGNDDIQDRARARLATPAEAEGPVATGPVAAPRLFQLIVRPIVKRTLGQRDNSGDTLDDAVFTGGSFQEILGRLWTTYRPRMNGRAIRVDGVWGVEEPTIDNWTRMMQFKAMRHLVESTKTPAGWAQWLQRVRGETVKLLIYEYGGLISRAQDYEQFVEAVIRPEQDRAGATAEVSLQDVVERLQGQWGATFQAEAVVWRMWANHITRNLNRSTWEELVTEDPPEYVAGLLRASEARVEHQVNTMRRSAHLALDAVQSAMADYREFRNHREVLGRRLEAHERNLQVRQSILEAFIRDAHPPAPSDVIDPVPLITNVDDTEHED